MKNNKKIVIGIIAVLMVVALFIVAVVYSYNNQYSLEIIQLSPQGKNQMMGYILKTKNNKIIVVDGGNPADKDNFMKYINENNKKVDYWFITHAHNDHASVLVDVINNENVQIDNIYVSLNEKEWYKENEPARADFSGILIDTLNKEEIKDKVTLPKLNEKIEVDRSKY